MFQLDYNYLAPVERRILRCLSFVESLDEGGLIGQLGVTLADMQLRYLIQSLVQLCYVHRAGERYSTSNTPPAIVIEIEDIAKQIADLDAQLAVLRAHG